jgi:hypothetical protein
VQAGLEPSGRFFFLFRRDRKLKSDIFYPTCPANKEFLCETVRAEADGVGVPYIPMLGQAKVELEN